MLTLKNKYENRSEWTKMAYIRAWFQESYGKLDSADIIDAEDVCDIVWAFAKNIYEKHEDVKCKCKKDGWVI